MGIFIIGGTNLDIKASSAGQFRYGTSNPGTIWKSVGGVGRNIAHSLALLGSSVAFCSAVGEDDAGREILEETSVAGVDIRPVIRSRSRATGTYLAIQDGTGELIGAVSDMRIMSSVTPEVLDNRRAEIRDASCLAADTNLPGETLLRLSELAGEHGIPLLIEPVSVEKAARLRHPGLAMEWITPNADELQTLWSIPPEVWKTFSTYLVGLSREDFPGQKDSFATEVAFSREASLDPGHNPFSETAPVSRQYGIPLNEEAVSTLLSNVSWEDSPRVEGLLVTLGRRGVLLLRRGERPPEEEQWQGLLFPAPPVEVRDPNGAGDAFVAGFLHALYGDTGYEPEGGTSSEPAPRRTIREIGRAIAYGQACAALTLESEQTTAPDLSEEKVLKRLSANTDFVQE